MFPYHKLISVESRKTLEFLGKVVIMRDREQLRSVVFGGMYRPNSDQ